MVNMQNNNRSSASGFTIDNALRAVFYFLMRDWKKYLMIALPASACIIFIIYMFFNDLAALPDVSSLPPEQQFEVYLPYWQRAVLNMIISGIVSVPVSSLIAFGVMQGFCGEIFSIREGFYYLQRQILSLVALSILSVSMINIGFLLLLIPGFILMILMLPIIPVCFLEQRGVLSSIRRSIQLMSPMKTSLQSLMLVILVWIGIYMIKVGLTFFIETSPYLYIALIVLMEAVSMSVLSVLVTVIYFYVLFDGERKNAAYIAAQMRQREVPFSENDNSGE